MQKAAGRLKQRSVEASKSLCMLELIGQRASNGLDIKIDFEIPAAHRCGRTIQFEANDRGADNRLAM